MARHGLLLVNLGTPDSPEVADVRRYLAEFLSDPRVLDIHPVVRWFLLHLIILRRRPRESAEAYHQIWTDQGSPLLVHSERLVEKVQTRLGNEVQVRLAMRYQSPSIAAALAAFRADGVDEIAVLPLFPQYASATTGSIVEKVLDVAKGEWNTASLRFVPPFYDAPSFLEAFACVARPALAEFQPDAVLMSFHGLPERHLHKSDESRDGHCLGRDDCCATIGTHNRWCYRAQCFATAAGLFERLDVPEAQRHVAFQSRLGKEIWIRPYTDERLVELARSGVKRLAVLCPAFVADCLETIEEIGIRGANAFMEAGGEALQLIPSLNSEDVWADAVADLVGAP